MQSKGSQGGHQNPEGSPYSPPQSRQELCRVGRAGRSHDSALPQRLHSSITKYIQTVQAPSGWETAEDRGLGSAPFAVAVHYLISSDVTRKRTVTKSVNNDHTTRCRKKESPQEEVRLSLHQENSIPWLGPCSNASYKKKGS